MRSRFPSFAAVLACCTSVLAAAISPIERSRDISAEYRRLAEAGNLNAQIMAGDQAWRRGDTGEAFRWLTKAAESGDTLSQVRLGDLYVDGRGTIRDAAKAAHWYALAVGNSADAQWKLGALFQQGDGVPENPQIAASMFRRAAEQGHPDAQNSLASLYIAGVGVKQNADEALKWFRKAADQGCGDAQLNLAGLYYHGIGVKQDLGTAEEWAARARSSQPKRAGELLAQIEKARTETRASSGTSNE